MFPGDDRLPLVKQQYAPIGEHTRNEAAPAGGRHTLEAAHTYPSRGLATWRLGLSFPLLTRTRPHVHRFIHRSSIVRPPIEPPAVRAPVSLFVWTQQARQGDVLRSGRGPCRRHRHRLTPSERLVLAPAATCQPRGLPHATKHPLHLQKVPQTGRVDDVDRGAARVRVLRGVDHLPSAAWSPRGQAEQPGKSALPEVQLSDPTLGPHLQPARKKIIASLALSRGCGVWLDAVQLSVWFDAVQLSHTRNALASWLTSHKSPHRPSLSLTVPSPSLPSPHPPSLCAVLPRGMPSPLGWPKVRGMPGGGWPPPPARCSPTLPPSPTPIGRRTREV